MKPHFMVRTATLTLGNQLAELEWFAQFEGAVIVGCAYVARITRQDTLRRASKVIVRRNLAELRRAVERDMQFFAAGRR